MRHDGVWFYFPPWRTRGVPPGEAGWCARASRAIGKGEESQIVRCPDCGRRLRTMTVDIEEGHGDFWQYLPPHKLRVIRLPADPEKTKAFRARTKKKNRRRH